MRALTRTASAIMPTSETGPFPANCSNSAGSPMMAALRISASPARNSAPGSVFNVAGSISTTAGCLNAPTRFLPAGRSTATLPPPLASTIASRLVGLWTNGTPRSQVAATNPAMSPITPPPSAITGSPRASLASANWS